MMDGATRVATVVAALGAATTGGVFFAFSTFVMRGLRDIEPRKGLTAMQAINVAAPTPAFMTALFGTAALTGALGVVGLRDLDEPWSGHLVVGGLLYLVGVVGLTIGYHVPRNEALALVDPESAGAARTWSTYASAWTTWNHVRTLTSLASAVALVLALRAE
jgi:uncharacterized membrane protein